MSHAETKPRRIRHLQRGATVKFTFGADCGRESIRSAAVAVALLSLLAVFASAATAREPSICQSNTSASEAAPQAKPADAADQLVHDAATALALDPAILPPIESIGAQTDIIVFLQRGVPVKLQLAALRRAWLADPAIRNFKGLQENDWHFNDLNSIPGFAELGPEVDLENMVAQILGETPRFAGAATPPDDVSSVSAAAGALRSYIFDILYD